METIQQFLDPGWVSTAIALVGIIIALIIYRASVVGPRPVYQGRALRLIGPDEKTLPDEVEILFKGQTVDRLTKTYIVFWNSGKALLRGSDIVVEDPLRFDFSDGSCVLKIRVVKTTRAANQFSAGHHPTVPNRVLLTFDYLDPGDGAVVELLHTDSKRYPKIQGTIKGVPKGSLNWGRIRTTRSLNLPFPLNYRLTAPLSMIAFGLLAVGFAVFLPGTVEKLFIRTEPPNPTRFRAILVVIGTIYAGLPLLLLWLTRRRFPRTLNIQELDE